MTSGESILSQCCPAPPVYTFDYVWYHPTVMAQWLDHVAPGWVETLVQRQDQIIYEFIYFIYTYNSIRTHRGFYRRGYHVVNCNALSGEVLIYEIGTYIKLLPVCLIDWAFLTWIEFNGLQ